jgi:hypothetical protein
MRANTTFDSRRFSARIAIIDGMPAAFSGVVVGAAYAWMP